VTPLAHARQRAALAARIQREFRSAWAAVDKHAIRASWLAQMPRLIMALTTAQQVAAASADDYVADAVEKAATREVVLSAFAGIASDGRPLESLLLRPPVLAIRAVQLGHPIERAMAAGRLSAELIGHTQVADAGRVADLTALTANRAATGYVRRLVGKTCARCMVLAGRRYSWKADFKRHPRCDCIAVPTSDALRGPEPVSPQQAFREMLPSEQDRVFGKAGAQSIRAGADIAQVVNARSGMYAARGQLLTTTGGTRRLRPMPETIIAEAKGDRTEAIRLLSLHGYIR
jgi:hypothetical protein